MDGQWMGEKWGGWVSKWVSEGVDGQWMGE